MGVATFSYIMGTFISIINNMKELSKDFDDGDKLTKFMGLLKQFNGDKEISTRFKNKLENFFEYRWHNDINIAINSDIDLAMLEQLPRAT